MLECAYRKDRKILQDRIAFRHRLSECRPVQASFPVPLSVLISAPLAVLPFVLMTAQVQVFQFCPADNTFRCFPVFLLVQILFS